MTRGDDITSAPQEEGKAAPQTKTGGKEQAKRVVKWFLGVIGTIIAALVTLTTIFGPINPQNLLGLNVTAFPSPTPQAFAPAKPGESLIIVADFEPRTTDINLEDPAQHIFQKLEEQIVKDGLNIRVERLRQTIDDNTARAVGEVYSATLLLWGWYGNTTIGPRIERFGLETTYISDEEGKRFSLQASPERIDSILLNDLPSQAKYLIFFTLSLEQRDLNAALSFANSALTSIQAGADLNTSEANFRRGSIYSNKGEFDEAIQDYDEAIKRRPDFAQALLGRGIAHTFKGDFDRAIKDLDQATELKPNYVYAFIIRGIAYSRKGDLDRAIADLNQATKLKPNDAYTFIILGNVYRDKGDPDQAISNYDQAINLKPDETEVLISRGNVYMTKGLLDSAIADYGQAIKLKPDYAEAFNNRGLAYSDKREYDKAITDFNQSINLRLVNAEAFNNRGIAYSRKGELDHALGDFDQAINLKPDYVDAFYNRGLTYYLKRDFDLAILDYSMVIKLKPDLASAYAGRGVSHLGKADKTNALADLQESLELTSDANQRAQIEALDVMRNKHFRWETSAFQGRRPYFA